MSCRDISNHHANCLMSSFFSSQVTDAIIKGISSSNDIFGGDLLVVVHLLEPILRKYNRDNEEVCVLTRNMFNISNTLLASCTAWTELTDFHQRYQLSTNILSNIDKTGFLFLSENPFSNFTTTNFTKRFTFQHLDVIVDTIDSERVFPHCYDFDEVNVFYFSTQFIRFFTLPLQGLCLHSQRNFERYKWGWARSGESFGVLQWR